MKPPTDDVWKDITSLSTPTTNDFLDFFSRPQEQPSYQQQQRPPPSTTTNMPTLLTTSSDTYLEKPNKRLKPSPQPHVYTSPDGSPPEYTEKLRRLMKNRESASRSRARKQARADELEVEVIRLAKENAKLKRLAKEVCVSQVPKESRLSRTKSAPF